jgi:hypothetical protein
LTIDLASQVVAIPDQVSCDVAGEIAILNLRDGVYYGLNPVGARIWTLIQQPTPVAEIKSVILAEFEVEPVACEADLLRVLSDLASYGLLDVV